MLVIRHMLYFSLRLFKEAILYMVLALDLAGLLVAYFTTIHLPNWFFWIIPILAIYAASFGIYRKGVADIRIIFLDPQDERFTCYGGYGDLEQAFNVAIHGHLVNFGPQAGV